MSIGNLFRKIFIDEQFTKRVQFLKAMSLFRDLSPSSIGTLCNSLITRQYTVDDVIFSEGELGKAMFFILEGDVEVVKISETGQEKRIATLNQGDFFGELALLDSLPRSATLRTITPSTILILYKTNFDAVVEEKPEIGVKVMANLARILSARCRELDAQITDIGDSPEMSNSPTSKEER